MPIDKARVRLGEEFFTEARQWGWIGEGAFIMYDVLDGGRTVQCIVSGAEGGYYGWEEEDGGYEGVFGGGFEGVGFGGWGGCWGGY